MDMQKQNISNAAGLFVRSRQRNSVFDRLMANEPQHAKDERQRLANLREARRTAALEALRPKLTPEFLATLAEAARAMGYHDWEGGGEVSLHIEDVFSNAGITTGLPDHEPTDFDVEQP